MTPQELLRECETRTHQSRIRRMVELGQLATSDPSIRETLAAFAQGDVYQRVLATQACYGSHDTAQITRALSDPRVVYGHSRSIWQRWFVVTLSCKRCSPLSHAIAKGC